MLITTLLFCFLGYAISQQPGCVCSNETNMCDCCAAAPNLPSLSACANLTWQPSSGNLMADLSVAGTQVLGTVFNQTNPKTCFNLTVVPGANVCFEVTKLSENSKGVCGQFNVDVNIFISIQFPLGVFALGDTSQFNCPADPYPPIPPPPHTPTPTPQTPDVVMSKLAHLLKKIN